MGVLHSVGAWLANQLTGSHWTVRGLARDTAISTNNLLWYRRDQLTSAGLEVEFRNFSNSSHVATVIGWNPSHVVFVPAGLEHGETPPLDSAHWGSQMTALVALLEGLKCAEFLLVSHSLPSGSHMTGVQAHMTSLEAALLAYHNIYGTQYTILRTGPVYGPWTYHSLAALQTTFDPPENSWYINDIATAVSSVLERGPFCTQLDLSPCPEDPTVHDVPSLLNISSRQPVERGLKKTLHWVRAYHGKISGDAGHDVILTSYFTSTPDYQRTRSVSPNRARYMLDWLVSVRDLGLRAVVFHDELDPAFQQRVSQFHPGISFRHVAPPLNRTTNDARFYAYLSYLHSHTDLDHVLLTDISDVRFLRNPFDFMRLLGNRLYIGTDIDIFPNMGTQQWISERLVGCFGNHTLCHGRLHWLMSQDTVFNAGVIGGSRHIMTALLETVTQYLDTTPPNLNCNMPAVNYVVHRHFHKQVFTGFPLTSRFYSFQSSPKGVYIVHK